MQPGAYHLDCLDVHILKLMELKLHFAPSLVELSQRLLHFLLLFSTIDNLTNVILKFMQF